MLGFEPRISGVGSDRIANCNTITAHGNRVVIFVIGGGI